MRSRTLERILRKHDVDVRTAPEMRSLVSDGERPSMELVYALNHVGNYMAALQSILIELSKKCKFKFPPKDWKPSRRKAVKAR